MTIGRLVGGLLAMGHRVQLVRPCQHPGETARGVDGLEELLAPGVPIPRYPGLRAGLPCGRALKALWLARRPDVVHIATEGLLGWSALRVAKKLGLPVATGFHTNFHSYSRHYGLGILRRPITAYLRDFHNATRATMVPTASLKAELAQQGYRNLHVVARGVDTRLFDPGKRDLRLRERWLATDSTRVALYVGRLAPEKNLDLVARAFESMQAVDADLRMVWVGDGPARAALARRYPSHVFVGTRTGGDLAAHYASADWFLFGSMTETFGNVILEAIASGLAVLAYDYAAAREHMVSGRSGPLAPLGDEAAFLALARTLVEKRSAVVEMRSAARAAAESVAWHKIIQDYLRVLQRVIVQGEVHRG